MSDHSTFQHDGKKYQIEVDREGRFSTYLDGAEIHHDTLKGLQDKIVRTTRKAAVRISLPATLIEARRSYYTSAADEDTVTLVDVTITGIHQRGGDILIQREDGKRERVNHYHGQLLKRLDASAKARYKELHKAQRTAKKAFEDYIADKDYTKKHIEAEVNKAEKAAGIEDGEKD